MRSAKTSEKIYSVCLLLTLLLVFSGCSSEKAEIQRTNESSNGISSEHSDTAEKKDEEMESITGAPTLVYQGQASIRIVTAEGKVIYIDPYAGDDYDLAADLILVTHAHFDHNAIDKIKAGIRIVMSSHGKKPSSEEYIRLLIWAM